MDLVHEELGLESEKDLELSLRLRKHGVDQGHI